MEGKERLKRYVRFSGLVILLLLLVLVLGNCIPPTPSPVSVRFLLDGDPLINKEVRVLCYASDSLKSFLPKESTTVTTDGEGTAILPRDCRYLGALYLIHEQPSWHPTLGPAYWVYATSWAPGSSTPTAVAGDIKINTDWKLTVFDVVVSLEWEPDPKHKDDLEIGLKEASAYLYDLTDGQMAFGKVTVYTDGENWDDADLRFLAANDHRPSAFVGGIVEARKSYTSPKPMETDYVSGSVLLGRLWNGDVANQGGWSKLEGYRTLVHEWAHYALFLYDEYLHINYPAGKYCTCNDLADTACSDASAMAYHYSIWVSELWHPSVTPIPEKAVCDSSIQRYVHGESDWDTLDHWGEIQGLGIDPLTKPTGAPADGPNNLGLAGDLFEFSFMGSSSGTNTEIMVDIDGGYSDSNLLTSHVYLIKGGAPSSPIRILHQGGLPKDSISSPTSLGTINLLDYHSEDTAWISVDRYVISNLEEGARYFHIGGVTSSEPVMAHKDDWNASLDLVYTVTEEGSDSKFAGLTARLFSPEPRLRQEPPVVQLCSPDTTDAVIKCSSLMDMVQDSVDHNTWEYTFRTPFIGRDTLPPYGVVLVKKYDNDEHYLIRWFEDDGGVGPAHMGGDAPRRDGAAMVDSTEEPLRSPKCSRVFVMPAADFIAVKTPLNPATNIETGEPIEDSIEAIIGTPLDVDILPGDSDDCSPLEPGDHDLPYEFTLTMFYPRTQIIPIPPQAEILLSTPTALPSLESQSAPGGSLKKIPSNELRIIHFDRASGMWEVFPNVADFDQNLGWIAAQIGEDGIYAVAWVTPTTP